MGPNSLIKKLKTQINTYIGENHYLKHEKPIVHLIRVFRKQNIVKFYTIMSYSVGYNAYQTGSKLNHF